jgi:hypothetical protein
MPLYNLSHLGKQGFVLNEPGYHVMVLKRDGPRSTEIPTGQTFYTIVDTVNLRRLTLFCGWDDHGINCALTRLRADDDTFLAADTSILVPGYLQCGSHTTIP